METKLISTYLLPIVLAFIMLGMGLSLSTRDFKNIFTYPKALFTGLACQMLILPVIALGIAWGAGIVGLSPEIQVGIVLIAACPGGAVSNLISHLLEANVALSVSLTTVNSFLVIFTIPTIVNVALWFFMGMDQHVRLPFWSTLGEILLMTVIPCVLGIYIRYHNKNLAENVERPLKFIMPVLLALAMLGAIFLEKGQDLHFSGKNYAEVTAFVLLLNIAGMALGYYLTGFLRMGKNEMITIAIETGLQNTGLALTIATSSLFLNNQEMAIPASIYALFTFFSAAIFGLIVKPELLGAKKLKRWLG